MDEGFIHTYPSFYSESIVHPRDNHHTRCIHRIKVCARTSHFTHYIVTTVTPCFVVGQIE